MFQLAAMPTQTVTALAKGLHLLSALLADGGRSALHSVAHAEGIPLPTAHRLALTLEAEGYIERRRKGHFVAGPALAGLSAAAAQGAAMATPADRAADRIRLSIASLARKYGIHVHFGVLEEGMVTYLLKENGGSDELFTQERQQQEAYCSAIGKVLLAAQPTEEREAYLANGPFVALTPATLSDPEAIRHELADVKSQDVAFDRFEIRDDLFCIAVPVRDSGGSVLGGLSASFVKRVPDGVELGEVRRALRRIARTAARHKSADD